MLIHAWIVSMLWIGVASVAWSGAENARAEAQPVSGKVRESESHSGTSSPNTSALSKEEKSLLDRARAYWKARELRDAQTIYDMESENKDRGGFLTLAAAARMGQGLVLRDVRVSDPKIDGDQGEVKVRAKVQLLGMGRSLGRYFQQEARDFWVRIDGEWYHKTPEFKGLGVYQQRFMNQLEKQGRKPGVPLPGVSASPSDESANSK